MDLLDNGSEAVDAWLPGSRLGEGGSRPLLMVRRPIVLYAELRNKEHLAQILTLV